MRLGDKDDLDKFYDLHLRNRKIKFRLLPQPRKFFALIWDKFAIQNQVYLLVATLENEIVAGILFLKYAKVLTYKFNASNPSALMLRPNDLLLWEGIDLGQRLGCDLLDFGLTDSTDAGLARYKMKFATHGKAITYITNRDLPKTDSPLAGITELLTEADVPDELTERAGALLYRYFA